MFKFCPNCANETKPGWKCCPYCGYVFDAPAASTAPVTPAVNETLPNDSALDSALDGLMDLMGERQAETEKAALQNKLRVLIIRGRYDEAKKICDDLIESNPMDSIGYVGLIRIASNNYKDFESKEVAEQIRIAEEVFKGSDALISDNEFADFISARKEYFDEKERKRLEAERAEAERKRIEVERAEAERKRLEAEKEAKKAEAERKRLEAEKEAKKAEAERRMKEEERAKLVLEDNGDGTYSVIGVKDETIKDVIIPNDVTYIDAVFKGCSNLMSITIPSSVTSIDETFSDCSSLTNISVDSDNSYFSSQDGILYNKDKTEIIRVPRAVVGKIVIPNFVTSIGNFSFQSCERLTSVTIPNSVKSIGRFAFDDCSSLTSISVDSGNPYFSSQDGILYNKNKTEIVCVPCAMSGKMVIRSGVVKIRECAFVSCGSLTSITLPNSVISIGESAFSSCNSLTSIIIPNSVMNIEDSAFEYCKSLTSINIPSSVTSISRFTFYCCSSLTRIEIPNSVTSIGGWAFKNCSSLTSVVIPRKCKYKADTFDDGIKIKKR